MEIIISENQLELIMEASIGDVPALVMNLIRVVARSYNSFNADTARQELEKMQSLMKQSIAQPILGKDRKPESLTEKEMKIIREKQRFILNEISKGLGFNNWTHLKKEGPYSINKLSLQNNY